MKNYRLKAFCKINLSLRVLKKLKNGYHKIQSFVTFGDLHDEITVKESRRADDKIIFFGRFKKGIDSRLNTITRVLEIFRKKNLLNKKKFIIKIKKNIPHSSGLGGGSSDAAALLNFINLKMNLRLNRSKIYKMGNLVGSDVPLNLVQKDLFLTGKRLKILKSKKNFNILIVFSNILCSTRSVYLKNKLFSIPKTVSHRLLNNKKKLINFLQNEHNDLEKTVINMYPAIGKIIKLISIQKGCYFSRLTGSGSACIGLFSSLKTAKLAKKNIKRNFPKYWCEVSKTI